MNILDYLDTALDTFDERPFCALDAALLSQACMLDGTGIIPAPMSSAAPGATRDKPAGRRGFFSHKPRAPKPVRFADLFCAEHFAGMFCGLTPDSTKQELASLVASPRFRNLELRGYVQLTDEVSHAQFSAYTAAWPSTAGEGFAFIGFRGTDTSFVGWRENLDMIIAPPVPGQLMAVEYVEAMASETSLPLILGGHSKGGNLATYAALRCRPEVRDRIVAIYDNDGPGFRPGLIDPAEMNALASRIHRTVPEESLVGMIMSTDAPTRVVKSSAKSVSQHNVYTWEVEGNDFVYVDSLAGSSLVIHDVANEWIAELAPDKLPLVAEGLFRALDSCSAEDVVELFMGGTQSIAAVREAARNLDRETSDALLPALARLAATAARVGVSSALPFTPQSGSDVTLVEAARTKTNALVVVPDADAGATTAP